MVIDTQFDRREGEESNESIKLDRSACLNDNERRWISIIDDMT